MIHVTCRTTDTSYYPYASIENHPESRHIRGTRPACNCWVPGQCRTHSTENCLFLMCVRQALNLSSCLPSFASRGLIGLYYLNRRAPVSLPSDLPFQHEPRGRRCRKEFGIQRRGRICRTGWQSACAFRTTESQTKESTCGHDKVRRKSGFPCMYTTTSPALVA